MFAWGAAAPYVRAQDHWPDPLIGAVFSATPLGYGTGTLLGGRLADRIPPRRLLWTAIGLLLAGFGVAFAFPNPLTFIAGYAFLALGLAGGIALTGALAAAVQAYPHRAGTLGGALTGTYAMGAVVHVPVVARLAADLGWVDSLRIAGGALALVAVAAVLLMPSFPAPPERALADRVPTTSLLRRPRILTGLVLEALATPIGAYAFVNAALFARSIGLGAAFAGAALIAVAIGNGAGRLTAGVLADTVGVDRTLAGICGLELAAGLLVATRFAPAVLAGALAAGLALGGAAGVLARMGADAAPDAPHSSFGMLFAGYASGALAGPLLGAAIGPGPLSWIALSALALPAMAMVAARQRLPAATPG